MVLMQVEHFRILVLSLDQPTFPKKELSQFGSILRIRPCWSLLIWRRNVLSFPYLTGFWSRQRLINYLGIRTRKPLIHKSAFRCNVWCQTHGTRPIRTCRERAPSWLAAVHVESYSFLSKTVKFTPRIPLEHRIHSTPGNKEAILRINLPI